MAVNFPNSPSGGDQVTFEGITYTYNASKGVWQSTSGSANAYSRFFVGSSQLVAGSANAVFSVAAGSGIRVDGHANTDTLTIHATGGDTDQYLQVANLQPQLDKYLQAANSSSFATTSSLSAYLQVANSTTFATTSSLDAYLQVANSTTFATTASLSGYLQVANLQPQLDKYLQAANSASVGSGNTNLTQSDSPPGSPSVGDLWFDSGDPRLYVYYSDGSSNQWVQASPSGSGSGSGSGASVAKVIALNMFLGG